MVFDNQEDRLALLGRCTEFKADFGHVVINAVKAATPGARSVASLARASHIMTDVCDEQQTLAGLLMATQLMRSLREHTRSRPIPQC